MGMSAGAGSPIWFMCPNERRERYENECWVRHHGGVGYVREHTITLTGRSRPYKPPRYSALGTRSSTTSREYDCSCGYHGWSNHKDLERVRMQP